jgi:hypothetical protein
MKIQKQKEAALLVVFRINDPREFKTPGVFAIIVK